MSSPVEVIAVGPVRAATGLPAPGFHGPPHESPSRTRPVCRSRPPGRHCSADVFRCRRSPTAFFTTPTDGQPPDDALRDHARPGLHFPTGAGVTRPSASKGTPPSGEHYSPPARPFSRRVHRHAGIRGGHRPGGAPTHADGVVRTAETGEPTRGATDRGGSDGGGAGAGGRVGGSGPEPSGTSAVGATTGGTDRGGGRHGTEHRRDAEPPHLPEGGHHRRTRGARGYHRRTPGERGYRQRTRIPPANTRRTRGERGYRRRTWMPPANAMTLRSAVAAPLPRRRGHPFIRADHCSRFRIVQRRRSSERLSAAAHTTG